MWFGLLTVKEKSRLMRIVKTCGKIVGVPQRQLSDLCDKAMEKKAKSIMCDCSHPLSQYFELLPSGRRLKQPVAKKNAFSKSFIPSAVSMLNKCSGTRGSTRLRMR